MKATEGNFKLWVDAMKQELKQLEDCNTWKKMEMYPQGPLITSNVLPTHMTIRIKRNEDGHTTRFKEIIIARRNHQING